MAQCNYPSAKPHPLTKRYWQVDDCGDICDDCHVLWRKQRPCKYSPCSNKGRYSSSYCGVCDIVFNGGKGTRL
jgi:hypothetical protein